MAADLDLAALEKQLTNAAAVGDLLDLQVGERHRDDPTHGAAWPASRTVRAEQLIALLSKEYRSDEMRPRSVRIRGARITGSLNLEAIVLTCPLLLHDCYIDQPVILDEATAKTIRFPGCLLPGLTATRLNTTGNLELNDGFAAKGLVSFVDARIGGGLNLSGGQFINPGGDALHADGLTVEQSMFCADGFVAHGRVGLWSARIGGQFNLTGGHLINPAGRALNARQLSVGQSMFCREGFIAEGEVHLLGAHINGSLDLAGGQFTNPDGKALDAEWLTVEHGMFCRNGFTADGQVMIDSANIGGQLNFTGGHLMNPGGRALSAQQLTVGRSMYCREGFTADGEVCLIGARIGLELNLDGGHFANPGRIALHANRITVEQAMLCRDGFHADGEVRLLRARIGSLLEFSQASLNNHTGKALNLRAANIEELDLRPAQPPDGIVNLANAHVGVFHDDQATWPTALNLRGFTYDILENDQISVRERLRWVTHNTGGYNPQIYEQLSAAYRHAGHEAAARRVGISKQWRRRSPLNPLNWLMYATVGYGYRTWLAAAWLAILTALGTFAFTLASANHLMHADPNAPAFHAIAYTLDLLLPVINLGQRTAFTPQSWALYWSWAFICAGWILTTAVVAALTGILKRD